MAKETRRTPAELQEAQYNYYIAFGFQPDENNAKVIEETIKKNLTENTNRRLQELRADILEIMVNDAKYDEATDTYKPKSGGRKEEREKAKTFRLAEGVKTVEDYCTKGNRKFIFVSDLENIRTQQKMYFTVDELRQAISYIEKQGVKIIDNIDPAMPFNDYKKTLDDKLNIRSLYAYLGVSQNASADEIKTSAAEIYGKANKGADLKKKQLASEVDGLIKKLLLKDPKYRRNYDIYITLRDDVWNILDYNRKFGSELTMEEYQNFIQIIVSRIKVGPDEAEHILSVGCRYYNIFVKGGKEGGNFDLCPYCGKLYIKGSKSCPHCGKPLEIICWNCHGTMAYSKRAQVCPTCGASHDSQDAFKKRTEALEGLLRLPNTEIAELESALLGLRNVIPNYASFPQSFTALKVKEYEGVVRDRKNVEEKLGATYREEIKKIQAFTAARKYYTAESAARSMKGKYGVYNVQNTEKLIAELASYTAKSGQMLAVAKQAMAQGNAKIAVQNAVKALELAEDCLEARAVLQKYPPVPPLSARATANGNCVRLEWAVSAPQDFVSYTVVKKVGVAPTSLSDGAVVAEELSITFLEDSNVMPATQYFYAVFAVRRGTASRAVVAQAPTIFADVSQVRQEVLTDVVKVVWTPPQNVKGVEVYKKEGNVAPTTPAEGRKIECETTGFTDKNVSGECAYLVRCIYELGGRVCYSQGLRSVFKPYKMLSPLTDGVLKRTSGRDYVYTGKSEGNEIKLYYAEQRLPLPVGKTLRLADFPAVAKGLLPLQATVNMDGDLAISLPAEKMGWVYPVLQNDQLFIINEPSVFNTLKGLNVHYSMENGTVFVKGTMHTKATTLILKVSAKDFPRSMDDDGDCFRYKREDFARHGQVELKLKANTVNYISVFAEFKEGNTLSYSDPFVFDEALGEKEKVNVRFMMSYTVSPTRPFKINLIFEAESEVEIPALLLMMGRPRPMFKTEGELVERIEPFKLKKGLFSKKYTAKIAVNARPAAVTMKYKLFTADDKVGVRLQETNQL